jgi:hypothetical protein
MSAPAATPDAKKPADNPFAEMIRNPAARTYLFVAAGALVVTCGVLLLLFNSTVAAAVVLILGLGGIALRWVVGPPAVVVTVVYFAFFPIGLPIGLASVNLIPDHYFNFADLLLTAAALVHLIATYRFHSILRAAMPFDAPAMFVKPGAKPTVRPAEPVRDPELWFLFARVGGVVLVGQLFWVVVSRLKLDFRNPFPLRRHFSQLEEMGYAMDADSVPNGLSRFLIAAGGVLGAAFVVWLVYWYWRLHAMNRDEAKAACLDQQWTTNRREYNRPEKWRGWQKQKLAGTLPKKGCGAWFLVAGLPVLVVLLCIILLGCAGAFG